VAGVIAAALGWGVLLAGAAALVVALVRRSSAHGILAPVLVSMALRAVVMVITHVGSVSLGDHGIFFLDDATYLHRAGVLADHWHAGDLPPPAREGIVGSYQFGYETYLALIFTLGTTSVLLGKIFNVLIGGVVVYVSALLGGRILGEAAKVRAAWVAALAPSLVWWSATLMKETLATLLLITGVLVATYLPRPRALAGLLAVLAVLAIVRLPATVALIIGGGLAIAYAGRQAEGRWRSRPLLVFAGTALAGLLVVALAISRGNLAALYAQYHSVVDNMFHAYRGGSLSKFPYDALRSFFAPLPWVFDRGTENWDRMLYPGVWLLICSLPLAALGVWRLRRRPEGWLMVGTIASAVLLNTLTGGLVFRQRSMLEPLILLLALAGAVSWQMAARYASATLGITALVAGAQSRSPLVAAAVLAAAGALFLISRRLPARPFGPLPASPLRTSFVRSASTPLPARAALRSSWAAIVDWRRTLVRAAPPLDRGRPAEARDDNAV
jgi:hypothetical protein